eukprot:TRINITY_DN90056_c0_g1_i1.p1 TRINITY_DN90056_c0_g1~~TRINITY_DN90056_c0_g1_i1.p1  ORF type:complete len:155 (+),score=34.21 TRINITY_DN90056_c0_g1_i1:47-466(+)
MDQEIRNRLGNEASQRMQIAIMAVSVNFCQNEAQELGNCINSNVRNPQDQDEVARISTTVCDSAVKNLERCQMNNLQNTLNTLAQFSSQNCPQNLQNLQDCQMTANGDPQKCVNEELTLIQCGADLIYDQLSRSNNGMF